MCQRAEGALQARFHRRIRTQTPWQHDLERKSYADHTTRDRTASPCFTQSRP